MNVAVYGSYNTDDTGPSKVSEGLSRGLAGAGMDVTLLCHGDKDDHDHPNVSVERIAKSPGSVQGFWRIQREAHRRAQDFDVFHPLEGQHRGGDVQTVQWTLTSLEMFFQTRAITPPREFVGDILLNWLSRKGTKTANLVIASSPETVKQMMRYWRLSPDSVLPLGVPALFRSSPEPLSSPVRILFPGRVEYIKGQRRVLQYLDPDSEKYTVDIVGSLDSEYAANLGEWKDRCHGFVSRSQLNEMYEKSDIAVVPSYHETFAMTALESVAKGCALVITDTCGFAQFEDVKNSDGVHVVSSGQGAYDALISLCDANLAPVKQSAYNLSEQFTWEHIADEYVNIYRTLL